jgi:hypothetical protein
MDDIAFQRALAPHIDRLNAISSLTMDDSWHCQRCVTEVVARGPLDADSTKQVYFWLRAALRSFFANVEAVTFVMRSTVLDLHQQGFVTLSLGEQVLLREESFFLDLDRVKTSVRYNRTLDNIVFAFAVYPRVFSIKFSLNRQHSGWAAFQTALRLRDSITHPKLVSDFQPEPQAFSALAEAISWFCDQMTGLFTACRATFPIPPEESGA